MNSATAALTELRRGAVAQAIGAALLLLGSAHEIAFFKAYEHRAMNTEPQSHPYSTHLNIHYSPLDLVDVPALIAACKDRWYNQTLCKVNDAVVRLGVMQGEYHWHKHDNDDEFFFVLEGAFFVDLEDRVVELHRWQGFTVPKGVVHRARAPERAVILMVENAGIVPTGD